MKFHSEESGFCRVYYVHEKTLYCFQEEVKDNFTFYVCTRDGEPSHPIPYNKFLTRLPYAPRDSELCKSFNTWLEIMEGRFRGRCLTCRHWVPENYAQQFGTCTMHSENKHEDVHIRHESAGNTAVHVDTSAVFSCLGHALHKF